MNDNYPPGFNSNYFDDDEDIETEEKDDHDDRDDDDIYDPEDY
jgi:hypothetical protein